MTLFSKVIQLLKKRKAPDIMVIGGGIIPRDDMKKLEKKGVKKLFGPGTPASEIIMWIQDNVGKKKKKTMKKRSARKVKKRKKTR